MACDEHLCCACGQYVTDDDHFCEHGWLCPGMNVEQQACLECKPTIPDLSVLRELLSRPR